MDTFEIRFMDVPRDLHRSVTVDGLQVTYEYIRDGNGNEIAYWNTRDGYWVTIDDGHDWTDWAVGQACPDFPVGTELRHHVDGSHTIVPVVP